MAAIAQPQFLLSGWSLIYLIMYCYPKQGGVEKASEDVVGEEQGMGELRSMRKRHGAFLGCVP